MQISPDKIAEVLARTDIVDLISRNVKLRKTGANYVGLCPFHSEKTGSFNVNRERRFFKCFGCDASGDAITFVQKMNGVSFMEALRSLAAEAGVDLEERFDPVAEMKKRLYSTAALAQRTFQHCLWYDPRGEAGREHLRKRGVSKETAVRFGLGYAPLSWDALTQVLRQEGSLEDAFQLGLVSRRQSGDGFFDVFRGRLTIPIRSAEGRNIAFGARFIEAFADARMPQGAKNPKYLNTKESPLYRKFDTLYGLDVARDGIRKTKTAVVVEGYFDVMGLHAAGIGNAVALCSTALTTGHLAVLDRIGAERIIMLLDGDAAGIGAVKRLSASLLATGKTIQVATLPDGEDPDEYALREGTERVEAFLSQAPTLSRHLLTSLLPRGASHGTEEKMSAMRELREMLREIPPGLARSSFISDIASHIGVTDMEVRAFLREDPQARVRRDPAMAAGASRDRVQQSSASPASGQPQQEPPLPDAQEIFLAALLMEEPSLMQQPAAQALSELESIPLRLLLQSGEAPDVALSHATPRLSQAILKERDVVHRTLPSLESRTKALQDTSRRVRLQRIESLLKDAKDRLVAALDSDADEEDIEALQENHRMLNMKRLEIQKS